MGTIGRNDRRQSCIYECQCTAVPEAAGEWLLGAWARAMDEVRQKRGKSVVRSSSTERLTSLDVL